MLSFLLSTLNALLHDPTLVYLFLFFDGMLTTVPVLGVVVLETPVAVVAGWLSAQGYFPIGPAMFAGTLGGVIGDALGYYAGWFVGMRLLRFPRIQSHQRFEKAYQFFRQHGGKSLVLARFIGPLRTIVPLTTGILRMPQVAFWMYNVLGAGAWTLVFFPLGYFFGAHWETIVRWAERGGWMALAIGAIALLWYWRRHKKIPIPNSSTSIEEQKDV